MARKCQRVRLDTDLTKLPIPKTWPMDGGPFVTLPLVVTKDPNSGEHNLGMYRAQVFSEKGNWFALANSQARS